MTEHINGLPTQTDEIFDIPVEEESVGKQSAETPPRIDWSHLLKTDWILRRFNGTYQTDEWGYDADIAQGFLPFGELLYRRYWRVECEGIGRIPASGRVLVVANHAGQIPLDTLLLGLSTQIEHPNKRLLRILFDPRLAQTPFAASNLNRLGQVKASQSNGTRLLEQDQAVALFPEGHAGLRKTYQQRYQLAPFSNDYFVRMALDTGTPILPVSIVGSEETYITLFQMRQLAKMLGLPYFPFTARMPFGPLALVPLPTKWYFDFGNLIDPATVTPNQDRETQISQITQGLRANMQDMINNRRENRTSIFGRKN